MIAKIAGRSSGELVFRVGQYAWNANDRLRLKTGWVRKNRRVSALSDEGHFFINQEERDNICLAYAQQPEARQRLLQRADKTIAHRFDLLGFQDIRFDAGGRINWHYDPVNNVSVTPKWWQDLLAPASFNGADPKIIWELNRHQHLMNLAQAYVISGAERYREEICAQLRDWMDANPPKYGINWSSSLELAYRLIAWLWTWFLCGGEDGFGSLTDRFIEFLVLQADHIEHNLSAYFSPNTHLSGEALGLYYVGTLFPELKGAERRRDTGRKWLMQCLDAHVLADGGYMERTLWYQRYTLDIYIHFFLMAQKNAMFLPESVADKILLMGEFLMYASTPERRFPLIGDDDGGRLLPLDPLAGNDLRGLFSTLAVIFDRGDFKYLSGACQEETLWLLGPDSKEAYDSIKPFEPLVTSREFREVGYFFMRSDWTEKANYLAFDCGPHGWLNCGHAHADLLSFQINKGGLPVVADPGTYTYAGKMRDSFRGADSHAVIIVDGFYPAVPAAPFQWEMTPVHEFVGWKTDEDIDYVAGKVKVARGWEHMREIFFIKPQNLLIVDTLAGEGIHNIEMRFPLYGDDWHMSGSISSRIDEAGFTQVSCVSHAALECKLAPSWMSPCYGYKIPAKNLVVKGSVEFPFVVGTLFDLEGGSSRLLSRQTDSGLIISVINRETRKLLEIQR